MLIIDILDLIGTAAFAISGAFVGIRNRLDLFGVFVLAVITASGGGLVRDIIIGKGMPVFFTEPRYLMISIFAVIVTCAAYKPLNKVSNLIKISDAIGLGVFTILAAYKSILFNVPVIGVVFIALLTGIGGGILRDIFVNEVPLVFRSEIYALAAIVGALCFYLLYNRIGVELNVYLCIFIVFAIRIAAIRFNLNLPIISGKVDARK